MNHFLTLLKSRGVTTPHKKDLRVIGMDREHEQSASLRIHLQHGGDHPIQPAEPLPHVRRLRRHIHLQGCSVARYVIEDTTQPNWGVGGVHEK